MNASLTKEKEKKMSQLIPLREWCKANGFGITTGYKLLKEGKIKAHKVGKLTMITQEEAQKFISNLPEYNKIQKTEVAS